MTFAKCWVRRETGMQQTRLLPPCVVLICMYWRAVKKNFMGRRKPQASSGHQQTQGWGRIWNPNPQSFVRTVASWRFIVVLVPLLFFTNWLGHRWLFERGTLAGSDVLLSVTKPRPARYCRLVTIDEHEFETYLGEWLLPEKLANVLDVIVGYKPKVVVVDIDTSAPRFQSLTIPTSESKIVWARVSRQEEKLDPRGRRRSYVWKAGEVLGNRGDQPEYVGSPLLPQDPDFVIRGFQRVVPIDANTQSLHWVTIRAYCDAGSQEACALVHAGSEAGKEADGQRTIRELHTDWDFPSVPLSDLMSGGGNAKPHAGELGDIVLVGAKFSDIHPTPFGPKLGVELTATAVETELAGESGAWAVYGWSRWVLKVLLALAIAWLNSRLMPRWASVGTLILLVLVFVASFLGIYYRLFRIDFLPFMIGIWIEQLIEVSEHAQHAH
jgi:CHASE2 domain-containing sensor protein